MLQLLGVVAAAPVGLVPVGEALVGGVGAHPLDLTHEPLVLQVEGRSNVLPLEAPRALVLLGRVGALDRVAQHRDELDVGQALAIRSGAIGWNM